MEWRNVEDSYWEAEIDLGSIILIGCVERNEQGTFDYHVIIEIPDLQDEIVNLVKTAPTLEIGRKFTEIRMISMMAVLGLIEGE